VSREALVAFSKKWKGEPAFRAQVRKDAIGEMSRLGLDEAERQAVLAAVLHQFSEKEILDRMLMVQDWYAPSSKPA